MSSAQPAFSIRQAIGEDSLGILDCLWASFEDYRADYTPNGFADTVLTARTVQERMAGMCIFVAISSAGEVIGTIGCSVAGTGEGHVRGMAVRPRWQGLGVAAQLLKSAQLELSGRGCSRITLDTTDPLKRAMHFYEKNGFRRSGEIGDFFGMRLIEYVKPLPS